jgi:hypothetical protein
MSRSEHIKPSGAIRRPQVGRPRVESNPEEPLPPGDYYVHTPRCEIFEGVEDHVLMTYTIVAPPRHKGKQIQVMLSLFKDPRQEELDQLQTRCLEYLQLKVANHALVQEFIQAYHPSTWRNFFTQDAEGEGSPSILRTGKLLDAYEAWL